MKHHRSMNPSEPKEYRAYPLFHRNLKLEELYRKYQNRYTKLVVKHQWSRREFIWAFAALLLLLSVPLTMQALKNEQELKTSARSVTQYIPFEAENGSVIGAAIKADLAAANGSYVQFGPKGKIYDLSACPKIQPSAGEVNFTLTVPATGIYYYWVRMMAPDSTNNSLYLTVDNGCPLLVGDTSLTKYSWEWVDIQNGKADNRITLHLTGGKHTFRVMGREPLVKLDKILLTEDSLCIPLLTGVNCEPK